ncbi:DUF2711 family protein [Janthinobacterium sp. B9-8]|uniref:DUF2711 family protein n=1 Tax=Janthinobacterium sp. B9-8 TaxID=1236179 RepID=UPI00061D12AD|nr:DUF2711 family protein [Janthinobacterium sp. B9-8]AMC35109.1 hypothetical protein VN23_11055 [Janthinobacterium sp. B9-8]
MSIRVLPSSDRYAVCPYEGSVLSFFEGTFEAAYVLLHPFLRPHSISIHQFQSETYPSREQICKSCDAVTWADLQRLSGLKSINEVDIALRTRIGGLKSNFTRLELAKTLKTALETEGIVEPDEGSFSELTHNKVLTFIQSQGYEWVWIGDEFCTERKLHWIEDLKAPDSEATQQQHCNVFTPDKKLLWTTHWDSHFSFFCGSHHTVKALAHDANFEGFECSQSTEVYWSVR